MTNSKKIMLIFTLVSAYSVSINAANQEVMTPEKAKKLVINEYYKNNENRHIHANMIACERYACLYPSLWCYSPCCCVTTPEEGENLISSYISSKVKTCQGTPINEKTFEPNISQTMIEAINNEQKKDIDAYYAMRDTYNPEKVCTELTCCTLGAPGAITAACILFLQYQKENSLAQQLPNYVNPEHIKNFAQKSLLPSINIALCFGTCTVCILKRAANL